MSGQFDGLRIAGEVYPVEGFDPTQKLKGYRLVNTVDEKLVAIPNEQTAGKSVNWNVSTNMRVKSMRVNLGIAAVSGNIVYSIRKNGTHLGNITIQSGVQVQLFQSTVLSNAEFNEGDTFTVHIVSTTAGVPAYHLNFQIDYTLR